MNPFLLKLLPYLWTLTRTLGQSLMTLLMSLLAGQTLRHLLYRPFAWIAGRSRNTVDDGIAEDVRTDWGIAGETSKSDQKKDDTDAAE